MAELAYQSPFYAVIYMLAARLSNSQNLEPEN
ncbi:rCG36444 [Rattus norvegicus]|uniref:RCG36444 n=1 Tax=Rattus norvegicus TaxID=10116 RepID=A6IQE8_RAT|nr:rCG36444 [Rattus norvegicus]